MIRTATLAAALALLLAACGGNAPRTSTSPDTDDPPPPPPIVNRVCGTDTACQGWERQIRAAPTQAQLTSLGTAVKGSSLSEARKANLADLIEAAGIHLTKRDARRTARTANPVTCGASTACTTFLRRIQATGNITDLTAIEAEVAASTDTTALPAARKTELTGLITALKPTFMGLHVANHDGGFDAMAAVQAALGSYSTPGTRPMDAARHWGVWLDEDDTTPASSTLTVWAAAPKDHESVDPSATLRDTYTGRATATYTGDAEGYARRGDYSGAFTARTQLTLDLSRAAPYINGDINGFAFRRSGLAGDTPPSLADWNGVRLEWTPTGYTVGRGGARAKLNTSTASTWAVQLYHPTGHNKPVTPAGLVGTFDLRFAGTDRAVGAFDATRQPNPGE